MPPNFSNISDSEQYQLDKQWLKISGKKRARQIWFVLIGIFIPPLWPILIIMWIRYERKAKPARLKRTELMTAFAIENGFSYTPLRYFKPLAKSAERQIDLPFVTTGTTCLEEMKGAVSDLGFTYMHSIINVAGAGNNGKDSQFPTIIFLIDLPVALPRLFINSKENNLLGLDPNAMNFNAREGHELEGDFPTYYSVTAEQNEQIDMYRVLTPEVMQVLIENNQYDVWINGRQLMLMTFADEVRYFAYLPSAFKAAAVLMKEVDQIARSMRAMAR